MKEEVTILVADRNRHIREFLRRELTDQGYYVRLAKSGREILKWIYSHEPFHLLILDPYLPDIKEVAILEELNDRISALPVILHAFHLDHSSHLNTLKQWVFVEKTGNSIERLKEVISEMSIRFSAYNHTERSYKCGDSDPGNGVGSL